MRIGRFILALVASVFALAITFALIFVGVLLWGVHEAPHDGQTGMGAFFVAIVISPAVAFVTFVSVLGRERHR